MPDIGKICALTVVKSLDFGVYLDAGDLGELLLPRRQVPDNCQIGDVLEVFIYHDTESRLITTIQKPHATVDQVGYMQVKSANDVGAFLDWGIPKDLFVPFREQSQPMRVGQSYLVYVYLDQISNRITGSSKLRKFLSKSEHTFTTGQEVDLIIAEQTDAGYKAIVDHGAWGLIFNSDVFQPLRIGQQIRGFIKTVRDDGKVDLVLQKPGYEKVSGIADQILDALSQAGGFLPFNDSTPPAEIQQRFGISKKTFKKAIGALFRERRIIIEEQGIRLKP